MAVAAVVLAAGASTRLGSPKQLALLEGEPLLERAVRVAREAGCSPVVVILGASAKQIQAGCELGDAVVVINREWTEGMGASIRAGVEVLRTVDGCVVMTCDMPSVSAAHLRRLLQGCEDGGAVASSYAGRRGVPAFFPATMFGELTALRGDAGARKLLQHVRSVELKDGDLDVDTPEALQRAREIWT